MEKLAILIFSLCCALPLSGADLEIRGQVRGQGSWSEYGPDHFISLSDKDDPFIDAAVNLRLNGQISFQMPLTLHIDYEAGIRGGDTSKALNLIKLSGYESIDGVSLTDASRLLDLTHVSGFGDDRMEFHRLDRLYLSWQGERSSIHIGRQALSWGNGMIFNPADLLNPFAPTDIIRDYKVGTDMLILQTYGGGIDDWQIVVVPRRDPLNGDIEGKQSSLASKIRWTALDSEWDLLLARHFNETVVGIGTSGYLGGAAWRTDVVYTRLNHNDSRSAFVSAVANIDYTWMLGGKNWHGFIEAFYNGIGESNPSDSIANVSLSDRLSRGELFTVGRAYLAGQLHCEYHPLINLYLSLIQNISDGSFILQPRLTWDAQQNLQLIIGMDLPSGDNDSEFGGWADPASERSNAPPQRFYTVVTGYF